MSDEELISLLPGRTKSSIECKRKKLGLKRSLTKYSFQDVLDEFAKREQYTLLSTQDEYKDCSSKMRYICKKHSDKGEQSISLSHLLSGRGCHYCRLEITAKAHIIIPDKEYDRKLCESKNFQYIDTVRKNGIIQIAFICSHHEELGIQYMTKYNMEHVKGCKYCSGKQFPEWYVLDRIKQVNPNIELLEPYTKLTQKVKYKCLKHDYIGYTTPQMLLKGRSCKLCGCEKLSESSFLSDKQVQDRISKINPHISLIKYNGATKQSEFYCNKHNKYFYKGFYAVSRNEFSGCEICYAERIRNQQGMGIDEFKKRLNQIHPELIVKGQYVSNDTPIEICCSKHDYTFLSRPVDLLKRLNCCEKGRTTYKEEYVCSMLENRFKLNITRQKTYEDCIDKRKLPFDIYLDDFNILIEYQGEQHFRPVCYSSQDWEDAKKKFEYTLRHDKIKREYCKTHKIPLLEIPYWEFDDLEYYLFDNLVKLHVLEEIKCA